MKKSIIFSLCAVVFSVGISIAIHSNQPNKQNDLIIANIEALSSEEETNNKLRVVPCAYKPWNECQPDEYYPFECYHKSDC